MLYNWNVFFIVWLVKYICSGGTSWWHHQKLPKMLLETGKQIHRYHQCLHQPMQLLHSDKQNIWFLKRRVQSGWNWGNKEADREVCTLFRIGVRQQTTIAYIVIYLCSINSRAHGSWWMCALSMIITELSLGKGFMCERRPCRKSMKISVMNPQ
jgi:hypothetical protein